MLDTIVIAYKLRLEFEPARRRKQSKNSRGTYQVPINIQLRQKKQTKLMAFEAR
jgi:hypothetical protein